RHRPSVAQGVTRETTDLDLLTRLCRRLGDQLTDGLVRVPDEGLLEKRRLREELLHLPLDDLVPDVLGLTGLPHLLPVHVALTIGDVRRYVLARYGGRVRGRDVHCYVADELLEVVVACDEIRLAVDLEQNADLAAHVHVAADDAFGGL